MTVIYTKIDLDIDTANAAWWTKVDKIRWFIHTKMKETCVNKHICMVLRGQKYDDLYLVMTSGDIPDIYKHYDISLHVDMWSDRYYDVVIRKKLGVAIPTPLDESANEGIIDERP